MSVQDGNWLLVLSEVPETDGTIGSTNCYQMRLVGTPVQTLERVRVSRTRERERERERERGGGGVRGVKEDKERERERE